MLQSPFQLEGTGVWFGTWTGILEGRKEEGPCSSYKRQSYCNLTVQGSQRLHCSTQGRLKSSFNAMQIKCSRSQRAVSFDSLGNSAAALGTGQVPSVLCHQKSRGLLHQCPAQISPVLYKTVLPLLDMHMCSFHGLIRAVSCNHPILLDVPGLSFPFLMPRDELLLLCSSCH